MFTEYNRILATHSCLLILILSMHINTAECWGVSGEETILPERHPLVGGHTLANGSQSATEAQSVKITYTQIM